MTGSVLVIGGGIAGLEAALDLADSGIEVDLVEKSPTLGGHMAQWDKTLVGQFPALWALTPKLLAAARNPRIHILTNSEITQVSGEKGAFKVTVTRHPRFVDEDKCRGCGICEKQCPVITDNGLNTFQERKAIYLPYPKAVPFTYAIDKRGISPCKNACPVETPAQGYIALIAQGRLEEALELIRETNPFPGVCGRVCTHPCESKCKRGEIDKPVAICSLKRVVADYERQKELKDGKIPQAFPQPNGEKVAIIGSGPAGLTAADDLAKWGYQVTVFEEAPVAGGMLALGIPEFRLPREILNYEIDLIKARGVEIKTNTAIGKDLQLQDLKGQGYKAIFMAIGAHKGLKLGIPGEDEYEGFLDCITFLRAANLGKKEKPGDKVIVIGGGNAAIDASRTALRLGAKAVNIVYRRSRQEMPANEAEIEEAEFEGVKIHYLAAPTKILGKNGRVTGMESIQTRLGEPDSSGRRRPVPIEGSEFIIDADVIIPAISQEPDISFLPEGHGLTISKWNSFVVDPVTLATNQEGSFAGGDAVTGPTTVIEAIAAGHRAAISIDRYFKGEDLKEGREGARLSPVETIDWKISDEIKRRLRQEMPKISLEDRALSFDEVELGFARETAIEEAKRCLNCGICSECLACQKACIDLKAIQHDQKRQDSQLNIGAIVVATGFVHQPDHGTLFEKQYNNIISQIDLERMTSSLGQLKRPSDGKPPQRVVFLPALGNNGMGDPSAKINYLAALKNAITIREQNPAISEILVLCPDKDSKNKGYETLINRANSYPEIKLVDIKPLSEKDLQETPTGNVLLSIKRAGKGIKEEIEAELVICPGQIGHNKENEKLAQLLQIEVDEDGFFKAPSPFTPISTRDGIYLCGCANFLQDIPESVVQASAAAAKAMIPLANTRSWEEEPEEPAAASIITDTDSPRIGVFICRCGLNIAEALDLEEISGSVKALPYVAYIQPINYACASNYSEMINEAIAREKLNRVVLAACSCCSSEQICYSCTQPRIRCKENLFQKGLLDQRLFEFVNIREQCAWIHQADKSQATAKAKDLIKMAVSRARWLEAPPKEEIRIEKKAIVIGGGPAGIQCAIDLAEQGFPVTLVEKEPQLGGRLNQLNTPSFSHEGQGPAATSGNRIEPKELLNQLIDRLQKLPVQIMTNTEVKGVEGGLGNFLISLKRENKTPKLTAGAIVLATGADFYRPNGEYGYGTASNVITNNELTVKWPEISPDKIKKVTFIQCVGSNGHIDKRGCSKYCCETALQQALGLKEKGVEPTILYQELYLNNAKAQGLLRQAQAAEITFIPYNGTKPPQINSSKGGNSLSIKLPGRKGRAISTDMIILSVGMVAREDSKELAKLLRVPQGQDGFFKEKDPLLGLVETQVPGIFLAGSCQGPKGTIDSMIHASAAASKAAILLAREKIYLDSLVNRLDEVKCRACGTCVTVCEFGAPRIILSAQGKPVARIDPVLCQSCGTCAAYCPSGAITAPCFTDKQINSMLESLLAS